jgi:hypothetical protein
MCHISSTGNYHRSKRIVWTVQVGSFSHDIFYGTIQTTFGFLIQIIHVQASSEITGTLPRNFSIFVYLS